MVWAFSIIVLSVLAGTLLALVPSRRDTWVGPVRTFALTASLAVVLVHLLPESFDGAGPLALVALLAGFFLPEWLGRAGAFLWRARSGKDSSDKKNQLALEASYFGLLIHQVGDGIGLGAFTGELYADDGSGGVIAALAAHAVPVVAIVVLTFDAIRGRAHAVARAVGMAVASLVGVLLTNAVPGPVLGEASAWVSGIVGGTLLHVVTHDLESQPPVTAGQKSVDFASAVLGILASFVGRDAHGHEGPLTLDARLQHRIVDLAVESAPLLVLGLFIGSLLAVFGRRVPGSALAARGPLSDALRGALFGARAPLCSCSVLPVTESLARRRAAPAFVVAFLLVAPELGFETLLLSGHFLGWEFAFLRLAAAVAVAVVGATVLARARLGGASRAPVEPARTDEPDERPSFSGFLRAFDDLFFHVGAWMVLGILVAASIDVLVPAAAFARFDSWPLQFLLITVIAVPSYVSAPSATPVAAALVAKGLSPGAALVGLLLGPATNVATTLFLRRWFGVRATVVGLVALVLAAWGFGALAHGLAGGAMTLGTARGDHAHPTWLVVLAWISLFVLIRSVWQAGIRSWLGSLRRDADGTSEHGGHAHGGHSHGLVVESPLTESSGAPRFAVGPARRFSLDARGGHSHGGHSHGDHAHGADECDDDHVSAEHDEKPPHS